MKEYNKGDYVLVSYDGEMLTGKILEVNDFSAQVEVCLSSRRGEKLLTDVITVTFEKLDNLKIVKN